MNSFFGILNRKGNIISPSVIAKMTDAFFSFGPDESDYWVNGKIALGQGTTWNAPESKLDTLPRMQNGLVIVLDGRLDNRDELSQLLEIGGSGQSVVTDSELILAAYVKWGEICPKYFVGDFAFSIWDEKKQQMFCARDHLGVRPFYYFLSESVFVCGNYLKALTVYPDISKTLSNEAVANYLIHNMLIDSSKTLYKDIYKLPPAHSMVVTSNKISQSLYWNPEEAPKVKLANAEEYATELGRLITQSVLDRMRSDYPIAAHLSGGLDSSAISVIASRHLQSTNKSLLTFNWVPEFSNSDKFSDREWKDSIELAEKEGIELNFIKITPDDILKFIRTHNIADGDSSGLMIEIPVRKQLHERGARTVLSGWGGDEFTSYHGKSYLPNMLKQLNFPEVCQIIKENLAGKNQKIRLLTKLVYHGIFLPFLPRKWYGVAPKKQKYLFSDFQFCQKGFQSIINKEKNDSYRSLSPQLYPTIKLHMLAAMHHGHLAARMESWAQSSFDNKMEYSYPLLDKRIIEFILGVPAKYFVEKGIGRYLFRLAVDKLLPDNIAWGKKATEPARIDDFLIMTFNAYKEFSKDLTSSRLHSEIIDIEKLCLAIMNSELDKKWLPLCGELWQGIMVLQCEKYVATKNKS